jgi:hypothetical protein
VVSTPNLDSHRWASLESMLLGGWGGNPWFGVRPKRRFSQVDQCGFGGRAANPWFGVHPRRRFSQVGAPSRDPKKYLKICKQIHSPYETPDPPLWVAAMIIADSQLVMLLGMGHARHGLVLGAFWAPCLDSWTPLWSPWLQGDRDLLWGCCCSFRARTGSWEVLVAETCESPRATLTELSSSTRTIP